MRKILALPNEFFNKEKINFAIEQAKEIEGKIKDLNIAIL